MPPPEYSHTLTVYRNKSKLYQNANQNHGSVGFKISSQSPLVGTTLLRVKRFLRAVHLSKESLNELHRTLVSHCRNSGVYYNNQPHLVEYKLRRGILFYTYKYFADHDERVLKPYDVYFVNCTLESEQLREILTTVSPNLFVRRPLEPPKPLSDDLGYCLELI